MVRLGSVYLLHFNRPYRHARHYVGFTRDLERRVARHQIGHGSPLIRAAGHAGIKVKIVRVWHNVTTRFERRVHKMQKRFVCPSCAGDRKPWPVPPKLSDYREIEDRYPENVDYDGHWEYQPSGLLVPIAQIQLAPQLAELGALTGDLFAEEPSGEREEAEDEAHFDQVQEWAEADAIAEPDDERDDAREDAEGEQEHAEQAEEHERLAAELELEPDGE